MSKVRLNQRLLETIKRKAKRCTRDDSSLSHTQWLDVLSAEYGYATFESLQRRVVELEEQRYAEALAAEEAQWPARLSGSCIWGAAEAAEGELGESLPLPVAPHAVAWPDCFAGSSLFTCGEGPRRSIDGPLHTFDSPAMSYRGEELRIADDHTVLATMISAIGHYPCGQRVTFSATDLDNAAGLPLPQWGLPVQYSAIVRTLWRLVHCELTVEEYGFKGPLLAYADVRQAPERFTVRFHPDFANFYYPFLALFR